MNNLDISFNKRDLAGLERAFKRHPRVTRTEVHKMFVRIMAQYRTGIKNNPWRVGGSGGGAPRDTGMLADVGHIKVIWPWEARIGPNVREIKYAEYVHEGTRKMKARPWLDYVFKTKMNRVKMVINKTLKVIVNNLAK